MEQCFARICGTEYGSDLGSHETQKIENTQVFKSNNSDLSLLTREWDRPRSYSHAVCYISLGAGWSQKIWTGSKLMTAPPEDVTELNK